LFKELRLLIYLVNLILSRQSQDMNKSKIIILVIALLVIAASLIGGYYFYQSAEESTDLANEEKPWNASGPEDEVFIYEDIEYAKAGRTSLELDLYRPSGYGYDLPAVVWIHGGGWSGGDKSDVSEMCEQIAQGGYVVVSLNFRLSDEAIFPASVFDVKAGVRWVRGNADEYDIDSTKIGTIGSSSGGHMASLLGTSGGVSDLEGKVGDNLDQLSTVQAVVDMFGPVDLVNLTTDCANDCVVDHNDSESPESNYLGCTLPDCLGRAAVASATTYIDSDDPPFFILHGNEDPVIPLAQSTNFAASLTNVGVSTEIIVVDGYSHDRGMFWNYSDNIIEFFNTHLK